MLFKILSLGASAMMGLAVMAAFPPPPPGPDAPPPPKEKGKEKEKAKGKKGPGPADDLRHAYDLLRRLRADHRSSGRPEERLRDWTERATRLYRRGIEADEAGDPRLAHEYGAAAHDLARAVDHARRASLFDEADRELPPPPSGPGPEGDGERTRRDLGHAYDRIREWLDARPGRDTAFYVDAARDMYNAARRDAEAGRNERAGELARAAEAMTHVPEHLAHAEEADRPGGPEPKGRDRDFGRDRGPGGPPRDDRPRPKDGRGRDALPPPLD